MKKTIIGISSGILLLISILSSYAFFISNVTSNPQNVNTDTATLALTFSDNSPEINQALEFGSTIEKNFTIKNTGTADATTRIMWNNLVNTYLENSLTYSLLSSSKENGNYTDIITNYKVPTSLQTITTLLAGNLVIPKNSTIYYKLIIKLNYLEDLDQTTDLEATFSTTFLIENSKGRDKLLDAETVLRKLQKSIKNETPDFLSKSITDETADGLYALADDYGTSYYYRGTVEDNYVQFGKWANIPQNGDKIGKPMYWRIIRINGDGSVRLLYDGTQPYKSGEKNEDRIAVKNVLYNTRTNDEKYVGYMYSPAGTASSTSKEEAQSNVVDSNIKVVLETWYEENILDLSQYISDTLFCNDRSFENNNPYLGYGNNGALYDGRGRFRGTKKGQPILTCPQKNDAFTVDDTTYGNGASKYPIGFLTRDESIIAGSGGESAGNNTKYYMYKGFDYWSMTPDSQNSGKSNIILTAQNSYPNYRYANYQGIHLVPVINLTPEYFMSLKGNGTIGNEYRLE